MYCAEQTWFVVIVGSKFEKGMLIAENATTTTTPTITILTLLLLLLLLILLLYYSTLQNQRTVSAYFTSKQTLTYTL